MRSLALVLLISHVPIGRCIDNGLGRTPPLGWTSWTSAWGNPNQTFMEKSIDALVTKGDGKISLSSLGYVHAGLDDGWQACGTGWNGSFHDASGRPLVNRTRFPNMTAMTAYGRARGINVGWYLNNCLCAEHGWTDPTMVTAHFEADVAALRSYGFDGAKFDACGQFTNLTRWEELINATTHPMMIENCHWGGDAPYINKSTGDLWCPYNIYRSGMDIVPNDWTSFMLNLNSMVKFLNSDPPLSRPGCWAYPDSVQTGSYLRIEEDRSNFGAWCITSAPLILGMDVTSSAALARVWDIVTNKEAIAVNQQWAGHPGRLVRQVTRQLPIQFVHARECNGSAKQQDWSWVPASGAPDSGGAIRSKSTNLCADAWSHHLTMEPCTGNVSQQFVFNEASGTIKAPAYPTSDGKLNGCLDVSGKVGPTVQLTKCYGTPNDAFEFHVDGVWADKGSAQPYPKRCMQVEHGFTIEAQLWAKPQPRGAVAVFALNAGSATTVALEISLEKDLGLPAAGTYGVRDIWSHVARPDALPGSGVLLTGPIKNHDSKFFLLTPQSSMTSDMAYV